MRPTLCRSIRSLKLYSQRPLVPRAVIAGAVSGVVSISVGCGGGTTGTSPIDGFHMVGTARSTIGAPLPNTDMAVRSGSDSAPVVVARTDQQGSFLMRLPSTVSTLSVSVGNQQSPPFTRSLIGPSILSTELQAAPNGTVTLVNSYEVQVDAATLCTALRPEGNDLIRDRELTPNAPCIVPFIVNSTQITASPLPIGQYRATITGTTPESCTATALGSQPARADADGKIRVDVAPVIDAGCRSFSVVVSHDDTRQPGASFGVLG
jgi:hypothetical protein